MDLRMTYVSPICTGIIPVENKILSQKKIRYIYKSTSNKYLECDYLASCELLSPTNMAHVIIFW